MAIIKDDLNFEELIQKCKECLGMMEQYKAEYLNHHTEMKKETELSVLAAVLVRLYNCDSAALKRDLAMVAVMGTDVVLDEEKRRQCLNNLFQTVQSYTEGDYSRLLTLIDSVAAMRQ